MPPLMRCLFFLQIQNFSSFFFFFLEVMEFSRVRDSERPGARAGLAQVHGGYWGHCFYHIMWIKACRRAAQIQGEGKQALG